MARLALTKHVQIRVFDYILKIHLIKYRKLHDNTCKWWHLGIEDKCKCKRRYYCRQCKQVFVLGDILLSKSSAYGVVWYHKKCAERLNII